MSDLVRGTREIRHRNALGDSPCIGSRSLPQARYPGPASNNHAGRDFCPEASVSVIDMLDDLEALEHRRPQRQGLVATRTSMRFAELFGLRPVTKCLLG